MWIIQGKKISEQRKLKNHHTSYSKKKKKKNINYQCKNKDRKSNQKNINT
jgi:hypothetical protein